MLHAQASLQSFYQFILAEKTGFVMVYFPWGESDENSRSKR